MPIALKAQAGFSLMELLAAVMILAIGLLGLAQLQITAITTNAHSDSITVANALLQKAVEDIAAMPADDATFAADVTGATWAGSPFTVAGAGNYNITYDVQTDFGSVTGLSRVTVHVQSATQVANLLGNKIRTAEAVTFKRSF